MWANRGAACAGLFAAKAAPTGTAPIQGLCSTCRSGFSREEAGTGYYRTTVRLAFRNTRRSM
ncbi:hypothetical protein E4195_12090 [Pseudomonas putida]|nr:hypothetical protein DK184_06020 [Pseudomonas sp. RW405]TFF50235.1 hypothetical protein C5609_20340 [Pseudomonas putida]TFW37694.1 hypothetical protein E4195_12090 [Pseudomonas putida]